ncbi:Suppressor of the cold-sensitive snRNP bioproteinsis mutant brr1-1, partial [Perkinsus olseni]
AALIALMEVTHTLGRLASAKKTLQNIYKGSCKIIEMYDLPNIMCGFKPTDTNDRRTFSFHLSKNGIRAMHLRCPGVLYEGYYWPNITAIKYPSSMDLDTILTSFRGPRNLHSNLGVEKVTFLDPLKEKVAVDSLSDRVAVDSLTTLGVQADAAEILRLGLICEPNYAVELNFGGVKEALGVNDKYAGNRWNLASIGMKEVWQALEGRSQREVVVAVIDTGVDFRHEDLAGNMFSFKNCSHGYNVYDNNGDVSDAQAHGTVVAGVLGAVTNNCIVVAGIAPVKIMPVKVIGSHPDGSFAEVIRGLNYALDNGADLSTHSYSGDHESLTLQLAVTRASLLGHLVVVAAANDSSDISVSKTYPCACTEHVEMLCVTSSDRKGRLASHSNYAPFVEIAAPGKTIFTTKTNNQYGYFSGTSLAVPHVTGAAAILYGLGLSGADFRRSLLVGIDDLTDRSGRRIADFGRLNVAQAVKVALTKPYVPPEKHRSDRKAARHDISVVSDPTLLDLFLGFQAIVLTDVSFIA